MPDFLRNFLLQRRLRKQARMAASPRIDASQNSLFRKILGMPGRFFKSSLLNLQTLLDRLSGERRFIRDLAIGAPALLLFLGVAGATGVGRYQQEQSGMRYWRAGERLLQNGEYDTAQVYLLKALTAENIQKRDVTFSLARAYESTGQLERADVLMSSLADVGSVGYPAAHRYLAIRTSEKVSKTQRVDDLESWFWHLSHADQPKSGPLQKSWGTYYLVGGDLENAIKHFRVAAEQEPALWLQVAELEARRDDVEAVRRTLVTARQRLEQQFLRDPGNSQNRLLYATSLFYIGELPNAEKLLKEGLLQEDNARFRQLLSAVFTRMYDVEVGTPERVGEAFRYLKMALDYEPNYNPALTRLVTFARSSPERLSQSRDAMRQLISTGNTSAMAHFTLSTIEWIAGNKQLAMINMRQAIELDPKMPVIANNLAYLMSQEENPNLEAALNLVNQAVEASPITPDFRDTRGEIYEQMGEFGKAAADYQQALATAKDKRPLQEKLARIYEQLGDPAMAKEFRDQAQGLKTAPQE